MPHGDRPRARASTEVPGCIPNASPAVLALGWSPALPVLQDGQLPGRAEGMVAGWPQAGGCGQALAPAVAGTQTRLGSTAAD